MRIEDSSAGDIYPPMNNVLMGYDENVKAGQPFYVRDPNLEFQLKIVKPFVGTVNISPMTMFNVYAATRRRRSADRCRIQHSFIVVRTYRKAAKSTPDKRFW